VLVQTSSLAVTNFNAVVFDITCLYQKILHGRLSNFTNCKEQEFRQLRIKSNEFARLATCLSVDIVFARYVARSD